MRSRWRYLPANGGSRLCSIWERDLPGIRLVVASGGTEHYFPRIEFLGSPRWIGFGRDLRHAPAGYRTLSEAKRRADQCAEEMIAWALSLSGEVGA